MRRMIKGVEVLFHLAYLVREGETDMARLQNVANAAFPVLDSMVDYLIEQKEVQLANGTPDICGAESCCNGVHCSRNGGGIAP